MIKAFKDLRKRTNLACAAFSSGVFGLLDLYPCSPSGSAFSSGAPGSVKASNGSPNGGAVGVPRHELVERVKLSCLTARAAAVGVMTCCLTAVGSTSSCFGFCCSCLLCCGKRCVLCSIGFMGCRLRASLIVRFVRLSST